MHDVLIIGAGPAGLTAGIYASRSGLDALILESGVVGGQASTAPFIENYPAFESIKGMELMEKMKKHCTNYCEIIEDADVINIKRTEESFIAESGNGIYESRSVIIATGAKHRKLDVDGEEELLGKGVSYCATCDGFFFKDKDVVVIGGGNVAASDALYLSAVGARVKMVHRSSELRSDKVLQRRLDSRGIEILLDKKISAIKGKKKVQSVLLSDGTELKCDGVFVSVGIDPSNELAQTLGAKVDRDGYIMTDATQRTDIPLVYAAGDVVQGMKQVVVACAQGAIAANSAYTDLKNPYWAQAKNKSEKCISSVKLVVNEKEYEIEANGNEKLLWALREKLGLTGTKFGCGIGQCGCCTVLVDGKATRSCVTPISSVVGKKITTIEGISEGHPVKRAWLELQVPQCGYCQSGQIMQAVSLLSENPRPSEDDIRERMNGNLCRCGTYERIAKAVKRASELREVRGNRVAEKSPAREYALNRWVRLSDDGRVVILLNKSEMGQGVSTALPQIVAEEMDADWDLVSFEFAPAEEGYNDPVIGAMETGGSTSVRDMLEEMKKAGAAARGKILKAASSVLGVSASELRTENGRVIHGDRSLSYGELAELASVQEEGEYEMKDLRTKELRRKDLESKVNGRAVFGIDVSVPGMVYATVIRAPAYGADLVSYAGTEGKAVRISAGIGVYADSIEEAWRARAGIEAEWRGVAGLDDGRVNEVLESALKNAVVYNERGKAEGETLLEARYRTQYISHAPMEPMNCVVWVKEKECEVWAPTQVQTEAVEAVREVTGMADIKLYTTFLGGGFGRRLKSDFIKEAAEISMKINRPVKLLWTREEDLAYDFYRPGAVVDMRARMHKGAIGVECRVAVQAVHEEGTEKEVDPAAVAGIWNTLYSIKDMRVEYGRVALPLRAGPWRSVGNSNNAFFMESFMDEVAAALKRDPLEFRLSMLEDERAKNVLRKVSEMSHWGRSMAAGCAQGLAFHYSFGSYCAEVAEVSTEDHIKVDRVFVAIDCGKTINNGIIRQQVEGAIIMGLSVALRERMSFGDSFATTQNFDSYRLLRMEDAPRTEILIVDSDASAGGVGEPALPPVAPAVANAVFRAGGGRLRELPLKLERKAQ